MIKEKEKVKETKSSSNLHEDEKANNIKEEVSVIPVTSLEGFENLSERWNDLTLESDSYIFQTYDWNRVWWKYFGAGQQLNILLFKKNNELIGIAPLFLDTFSVSGFTIYNCLRFIGSTVSQPEGEELQGLLPYSDYMDFIIKPGFEEAVITEFSRYLIGTNLDFDELILEEVPEKSALWSHLIPVMNREGFNFQVKESSGCPIIELGCSWEEHLNSLSKSSRYRTRRYVKKATKPDYKIFDVKGVDNVQGVEEAYEHLVNLHQERWNDIGFPGTFGEDRMYQFFKEISTEFFKKGWSQLKLVNAIEEDGKCVAVDLIFKYKDRTYLVHRAIDGSSPSVEESPGNVALYMMVKEAAEEKKKEFDLLRGTESYKFRSANSLLTNKSVEVENPQKNSLLSVPVKMYVQWKRRMNLEFKQCKIFLTGEGSFFNKIREYGTFLSGRAAQKWKE